MQDAEVAYKDTYMVAIAIPMKLRIIVVSAGQVKARTDSRWQGGGLYMRASLYAEADMIVGLGQSCFR